MLKITRKVPYRNPYTNGSMHAKISDNIEDNMHDAFSTGFKIPANMGIVFYNIFSSKNIVGKVRNLNEATLEEIRRFPYINNSALKAMVLNNALTNIGFNRSDIADMADSQRSEMYTQFVNEGFLQGLYAACLDEQKVAWWQQKLGVEKFSLTPGLINTLLVKAEVKRVSDIISKPELFESTAKMFDPRTIAYFINHYDEHKEGALKGRFNALMSSEVFRQYFKDSIQDFISPHRLQFTRDYLVSDKIINYLGRSDMSAKHDIQKTYNTILEICSNPGFTNVFRSDTEKRDFGIRLVGCNLIYWSQIFGDYPEEADLKMSKDLILQTFDRKWLDKNFMSDLNRFLPTSRWGALDKFLLDIEHVVNINSEKLNLAGAVVANKEAQSANVRKI